ncbi:hypothetical protein [Streptomyces sp. NPDC127098]|uniref:hypothetical protein n=1 Tax=Streptomyces sp. NPDC127098 TaxID=3347137 RepID=UPI003651B005
MPGEIDEDENLDLTLSEEESTDWELLVDGVYEQGGAFMICGPPPCASDCVGGC